MEKVFLLKYRFRRSEERPPHLHLIYSCSTIGENIILTALTCNLTTKALSSLSYISLCPQRQVIWLLLFNIENLCENLRKLGIQILINRVRSFALVNTDALQV